MRPHPRCDIFCRVIDNYGDIGVCWRLARQLAAEHGWQVRLWVDELAPMRELAEANPAVEVQAWPAEFPAVTIPDVVIEAFACELPEPYLNAMAQRATPPVWLNLEYLCVEAWGADFHARPSPHPRLPLTKHFFVPGVLPGTGGVLCEAGLEKRRQGFDVAAARRAYSADANGTWVFLFSYTNPAFAPLLDCWAHAATPVHCLLAAGLSTRQAEAWLGVPLIPGQSVQRGQLTLHPLPFVKQPEFDALLWTCDLNFVRGEDSFCRAQLAAQPFIWQIYAQTDAAHLGKLADFEQAYRSGLPAAAADAWHNFQTAWNAGTPPPALAAQWQALQAQLPTLRPHAATWLKHLISLRNLAENLAIFCKNR